MVFVFKLFIMTFLIICLIFGMLHLKFFQLNNKVGYKNLENKFKSIFINYLLIYSLTLVFFINLKFLPVLLVLVICCQK